MRPIERALEEYPTPENETIRGYCLAVRASLTDDGRSPLDAPGLRLYERVSQISASIGRIQEKKVTPALKQLHQLLTKGLQATAPLWPPLQRASHLVHQAAQILANEPQHTGAQVRAAYLAFVQEMQEQQAELGPLGECISHFCHITHNFAPGLFQCYDVEGLPCINNELEACFGHHAELCVKPQNRMIALYDHVRSGIEYLRGKS